MGHSHKLGVQQQNNLGPAPWGPGDGSKDQLLLNYNKSILKFFIPNFACVLSNKRYKHIEQDYCFDAWVMPHVWDMGKQGCQWGSKNVKWHIKLTQMMSKTECRYTHPMVNRVILE